LSGGPPQRIGGRRLGAVSENLCGAKERHRTRRHVRAPQIPNPEGRSTAEVGGQQTFARPAAMAASSASSEAACTRRGYAGPRVAAGCSIRDRMLAAAPCGRGTPDRVYPENCEKQAAGVQQVTDVIHQVACESFEASVQLMKASVSSVGIRPADRRNADRTGTRARSALRAAPAGSRNSTPAALENDGATQFGSSMSLKKPAARRPSDPLPLA